MKTMEYEELLAQITPLDLSTLTRLEADVACLVSQRQAEKSGTRRSIAELAALAEESLAGLDREAYWREREKEMEESRASWAERESEFDREHRS